MLARITSLSAGTTVRGIIRRVDAFAAAKHGFRSVQATFHTSAVAAYRRAAGTFVVACAAMICHIGCHTFIITANLILVAPSAAARLDTLA